MQGAQIERLMRGAQIERMIPASSARLECSVDLEGGRAMHGCEEALHAERLATSRKHTAWVQAGSAARSLGVLHSCHDRAAPVLVCSTSKPCIACAASQTSNERTAPAVHKTVGHPSAQISLYWRSPDAPSSLRSVTRLALCAAHMLTCNDARQQRSCQFSATHRHTVSSGCPSRAAPHARPKCLL